MRGFAIGVMASVLSPAVLARMGGADAALEALVHGTILLAMAFTDPGAGPDMVSMRTIATKADAGFVVAAIRAEYVDAPRAGRAKGIGLDSMSSRAARPASPSDARSRSSGCVRARRVSCISRTSSSRVAALAAAGRVTGFRRMMTLLDFNCFCIAALFVGIAQAAFEASLR